MKKVLFAMGAFAILALGVVTVAGARGPDNEFATGSGKSDLAVAGTEHIRFSAHNAPAVPGNPCPATGHINYSTDVLSFSADVTRLTVNPNIGNPNGGRAFVVGIVTNTTSPTVPVGATVWFDFIDSGMSPAGTGDQVRFEAVFPGGVNQLCLGAIAGHPIDQGNVIVKVD